MRGSVFKRCGCTEVVDGRRRQLGRSCPKLKRPDGAWNPRHGTWYFGLDVEGVGGKRDRVIRGGFDSRDDAQDAMDKVKSKAAKGIAVNDRLTVGEYLREWIKGRTDLKLKTRVSYEGHIRRFYVPHIGHVRMSDLRVAHVNAVFEAISERNELVKIARETGRRTKDLKWARVVGPSSMQRIRATLRSALSDALREEGTPISVNVAALVKLPSGKRAKALVWTEEREARWRQKVAALVEQGHTHERARDLAEMPSPVMVWRPDHLGAFLDHVHDDRLYALWHVIAHRGPRRGEACGFEWLDFSKKAKTLTVERQLLYVDGEVIEDTPKSDAGGRVIALDAGTVDVLGAHRKGQLEERLAWGEAWVDSGKIFTKENGEALHPEWVSDEFARVTEECDLPPIRLHDLRHGAASLMLAAGVDLKVVQETLGHANLATTANTYTSVYPDVATAAAEAAAAIVPRKLKKDA